MGWYWTGLQAIDVAERQRAGSDSNPDSSSESNSNSNPVADSEPNPVADSEPNSDAGSEPNSDADPSSESDSLYRAGAVCQHDGKRFESLYEQCSLQNH